MPTIRKSIPTIRKLAAVLAVGSLALSACADAPPPRLNEVGGRALVLGPDPGFDPARLADPWWRSPQRVDGRFVTVDLEGALVLRINAPSSNEPTTAVIGRRLASQLLATPYLRWAWYLEPTIYAGGGGDGLDRGLRISVGFYGGAPSSPQLTDRLFGGGSAGYPLYDRRIDIVFGGVGAARGEESMQHMTATNDDGRRTVLRPAQRNQSGDWKMEAIDLAKLYQEFWPRDRIERAQITSIAVGGLAGRPALAAAPQPAPLGYVAEITLTR